MPDGLSQFDRHANTINHKTESMVNGNVMCCTVSLLA